MSDTARIFAAITIATVLAVLLFCPPFALAIRLLGALANLKAGASVIDVWAGWPF